MSKIDDLIEQSLSEEDEKLLSDYAAEPGYFRQAFGLFRGPLSWVMWLVMICNVVIGLFAIWAVWQAMTAGELILTVRWGVAAVIAVQIVTFLRGFMGDHFEANRVLRELKRLELRLVRMESTQGRSARL
jgi:hypothetical protein